MDVVCLVMGFVKLDCGMLDSTLWIDREARELFITALLMATPYELKEPAEQICVRTLDRTGFTVPPGWYGLVEAAGVGIVRRAGMESETGLAALERLGSPEADSRTPDYDGRRLVRIDGGYIALNYVKYREKDHTSAERSKRYREKKFKKLTWPGMDGKPASARYKAEEQRQINEQANGLRDENFEPVSRNGDGHSGEEVLR